jgi:PspA-Associated protein
LIVRISTEGQYELGDDDVASLNKLDNAAVAACDTSDEARFQDSFAQLLDYVRVHGHPLADDDLRGSDLILPPPDVSLEEAKGGFNGEGLIPG